METFKRVLRVLGAVVGGMTALFGLTGIVAGEYALALIVIAFGVGLLFLSLHRSPEAKAEAAIRAQARRSERFAKAEQARADAERRARLASEERTRQEEKRRQQQQAQQAAWHEHVMRQQEEEQAWQRARTQRQPQQPPPPRQEASPRYGAEGCRATVPPYKPRRQQERELRDERKAAAREEGVACCPRCGSTSLSANKRGFKGSTAFLFGPLAGTFGMNKLRITCLNCGYQYRPGKKSMI